MDDLRREDEEPLTPRRSNSNVFGDENEVLDVADGFRRHSIDNLDMDDHHSTSEQHASNPLMTFSPPSSPRHSTRNSLSHDDPFDDSHTTATRTPSTRSSQYAPGISAHRSISSASSHHYASTNSPRLGAAGPSHPYTMYPQGTMARTPSVATSSTAQQPKRQSSLRTGPQHPYGMYTQGIADSEAEDDDEQLINPVPIGFGLTQTYRRVRGPEGEEQDIIGEYGHTEQLPPYSRYADDEPEKVPLPVPPAETHTRAPVEGSDPGMPLMHQRMSQPQSMTDNSQLEQATPLLADMNDDDTTLRADSSSSALTEKSWKEKTWKERRKHKIFGVRFSVCLMVFGGVAFVFAVLVGSLVGYLAGSHGAKSSTNGTTAQEYIVTTSFVDAKPIATPTNAQLPTGMFALTLSPPQATQADCLTVPSQRAAWDCNLAGRPAVAVTVGLPASSTPSMAASLFYAASDGNISYGAQYQYLQTSPSNLISVQDNDDPALGAAYFFQQVYNKVVVLPENTFPTPNSKRQATPPGPPPPGFLRKQLAQPGERPWFCYFNNTVLEGFLYMSQPAVLNHTSTTSSTPTSSITTSSSASTSSGSSSSMTAPPLPPPAASASPSASSASGPPPPPAAKAHKYADDTWSLLYPYPSMVKLEERRMPENSTASYCQQMVILNDGVVNIAVDSHGDPIKIYLQETDPPFSDYQSAGLAGGNRRRASTIPGGCHCQWTHGA